MNHSLSLKAFIGLLRSSRFVSDIAKKDIKKYGLSLTEFEALELLYHKGPVTIQVITKKVLLTSGSMTYVIDQLERKGLVNRKTGKEDRRNTYAVLTQQGIKLMEDIFPKHQQCIENIFSSLTDEEKKMFIDTLKKISKI